MDDFYFLKRTLMLAKKGIGRVSPNPMVGAILVKDGNVLGKGYHRGVGLPHAEIEALNNCKEDPKGATLYVNLEPCVHFGRTPPCIDAIIQAGIKRIVCCSLDPNPKVAGKGAARLRSANVLFEVDLLRKEAQILNETFFTFHKKKRPFIAIKFASSLDGKIATYTGDSKWITNEKAREYARNLRAKHQAVLVGINTVLRDDPSLGNSLRIVLDSKLKIPLNSKVLRDTNIIIATTELANKQKKKALNILGVRLLIFKGKRIPLLKLLDELRRKEIISILVEGGGSVLGSFLDKRLVDKVYAFYSPVLIGGEKAVSAIGGKGAGTISGALHLKDTLYKRFDDNFLITGYVE